jgi:hypothetical protein
MKKALFVGLLVACSGGLNGETREADPDAALLPRDIGVFITQTSHNYDASVVETILPGTHQRVRVEGFGLDIDMQARRLVDPSGRERIFTLHATQGLVVERDRNGGTVKAWPIYDAGGEPGRANPRDAAFASDGTLWVTRHGVSSLARLNLKDGTFTKIDLKAFADDDGVPDMSAITIDGETAYVALRRLEGGVGTTKNDSTIVAIDTNTLVPRAFVTLPAKNPIDRFRRRGSVLWISCIGGPIGEVPDRNAALVRIEPATSTAKVVMDEKAAGGFVTAFELVDDVTGYAIVAEFGGDNPTSVVRFDPSRGAVVNVWAKTSTYALWDVRALPSAGLLLVADRSPASPGIRILSTQDGARLGHIPTRLPPVEFFFLRSPDS